MPTTANLTPRQRETLDLIAREPYIGPRRVAGEFGLRSQDAGRTIKSLERAGLIEFALAPEGEGHEFMGGYRLADGGRS